MNYKIQSGDTLGALAKRFGTSVDALAKANRISDPNKIKAGAQLVVPDKFEQPQAHRAARDAQDGFEAHAPAQKPAQISEPRMPGRDASDAELAQYEKDMAAYAKTLPITPADRSSVTAPAMPPVNASVADKVRYVADAQKYLVALEATGLRAPANFTKPPMPSADATLQELAQYTRNVRAYAAAMQ